MLPATPSPLRSTRWPAKRPLGRGKVADSTTDAGLGAGLTTEAILEVILEVSFATLVGLVDNFAGRVELDGFLAERSW